MVCEEGGKLAWRRRGGAVRDSQHDKSGIVLRRNIICNSTALRLRARAYFAGLACPHGAIVVVDANDEVVGLISERKIVEAEASRGIDALHNGVASHMDATPHFAHENDTVDQTMETVALERRRHLPVLRDGRLSGIVSIGDVVVAEA